MLLPKTPRRWLPVAVCVAPLILLSAPADAQGFGGRHNGGAMHRFGPGFGPGRHGYPPNGFGPHGYGPFHPGPAIRPGWRPGWRPYPGRYRPPYWRGPYYNRRWYGPYWPSGYGYGPFYGGGPFIGGVVIGAQGYGYHAATPCYRATKPVLNRNGRWVRRLVTVCHDY